MTSQHPGAVDAGRSYAARPIIVAFLLDAVLVTVFSALGRASHGGDVLADLWSTSWTFLLALVIAWGVTFAWRAPLAVWRTGVPVWVITTAGGMLLRWATGQGVQIAFVLVAASVLLAMLVGWRVIALLIRLRMTRAGAR